MSAGGWLSVFLAGVLLAPLSVAAPVPNEPLRDDCAAAPPCGPITVIITIILDKSKGITFGEADKFETQGKVSYWFDINEEGYWYDLTKEVWITFKVMKHPAWLKATITPERIKVPVRPQDNCTECIRVDPGDPSQVEFYWEGDVAVSVEKLREPTAAELKKALKSDGTYRISLSGASTDSYLTKDPLGSTAGLQEGYGPKELRFIPEGAGAGQEIQGKGAGGAAPSVSLGLFVIGLVAVFWARRRHD